MHEFVSLNLSRDEYHTLVRLLGHHTTGTAIQPMYERLVALRPIEAAIAENMGPLCKSTPVDCHDLYGKRPLVMADAT